jgi:hypothetical protein
LGGISITLRDVPAISSVIRIDSRPTEHLNFKVQPGVIASLDRAASRLRASRSAVARALLQSAMEHLDVAIDGRSFAQKE